jgi:hypothetical protein
MADTAFTEEREFDDDEPDTPPRPTKRSRGGDQPRVTSLDQEHVDSFMARIEQTPTAMKDAANILRDAVRALPISSDVQAW